jgi:hypothetical protein
VANDIVGLPYQLFQRIPRHLAEAGISILDDSPCICLGNQRKAIRNLFTAIDFRFQEGMLLGHILKPGYLPHEALHQLHHLLRRGLAHRSEGFGRFLSGEVVSTPVLPKRGVTRSPPLMLL